MQFKFVFCSKGMETIQAIEVNIIFGVIPLNNADNVFTAR